jgi:hypothetical protein
MRKVPWLALARKSIKSGGTPASSLEYGQARRVNPSRGIWALHDVAVGQAPVAVPPGHQCVHEASGGPRSRARQQRWRQ